MTKTKETETQAPETAETGNDALSAVRSRKILTMPQFIPSADWINKEVVAKGKGHKVTVGRLYGIVGGTREKLNKLPNGDEKLSIALLGMFEAFHALTGEISEANVAYLPDSVGERMKAMFANDPELKAVQIDMDIAVEATGKTIPYTWAVTNYVKDEAANPLKALRANRAQPLLTSSQEQAKLTAPK